MSVSRTNTAAANTAHTASTADTATTGTGTDTGTAKAPPGAGRAGEARTAGDGPLAWPPLVALSLGYFLVMLDVTVVTVAVPTIRDALAAGTSAMAWVVDGYSTAFAGLLLLGGSLGDRLGHRRVFLTGLGVFTIASLGCGAATTPGFLIAARLLQGAGGALMVPTSLALLAAAYPGRAARAKALGVWGGVAGVAFAAGPLVGGLLVAGLDWRAAFWLNVPVAVLAAWLTRKHVPVSVVRPDAPGPGHGPYPDPYPGPYRRPKRGRSWARNRSWARIWNRARNRSRGLDLTGQILGIVALTALAGALNEAGARGWTSPLVLGTLGAAGAALLLFVRHERRLETRAGGDANPLLPPSLFQSPAFSSAAAIGVLLNLGYYGMLYASTLYFRTERGYDALATGIALLPTVCMAVVAAPLSGRLTARYGPRLPMTCALLLGAVGFLGWLLAGPETPYGVLLFALIATGLATPTTVPAATASIVQAAPNHRAGVASAVFNVARQTGNSLGVALFSTLIATSTNLVAGFHAAAVIAAAAFFTGALLAATS
ncbi:MFS transporter [Streptomyces sp. URMC 123]|uniref:MFS transporter n=2 Tax=unclassified Streptomyces TaxID=2593676 RepID=UPI003F1DA110